MKMVDIILRQAVPNLGDAGQVVSVRAGFARNYLLPRGFAYVATPGSMRRLEEEQQRMEQKARRDFLEAGRRAASLEDVALTFQARAGEEGKLFGSVTVADIADRLNEGELGFEVDRRQIELDEPLKTLGVFPVPVRLHPEVRPEIKVWVVKEE